jgi:hypothetical protein
LSSRGLLAIVHELYPICAPVLQREPKAWLRVQGRGSLAKHRPIVTEDRSIKNMTASAKGTAEEPGQKRQAKGRGEPRDPGRCAGVGSQCPVHQSAKKLGVRSFCWLRAGIGRLGGALLAERFTKKRGPKWARLRVWVRGDARSSRSPFDAGRWTSSRVGNRPMGREARNSI